MNYASVSLSGYLRRDAALKVVLAVFLVYWICMLPVVFGGAHATRAAARVLTLPAMLTMLWIASSKARELLRQLAVLGQLQAPHALRRAQIGERLRTIGAAWLLLALGTSLQLSMPNAGTPAITGATLVSLAGCAGMLRAVARAGRLPVFGRNLVDAATVLPVVALVALDQNRLLDVFAGLPPAVLAAGALLFPALLLLLASRWKAALPRFRWSAPAPASKISAWLETQNRRMTVLTWRKTWEGDQEHRFFSTSSVPARLALQLTPIAFLAGSYLWAAGKLHPASLIQVLLVGGMMSNMLLVRDMHWRSLLRPGGLRRNGIATHIWASTMSVQLMLCVPLVFLYMVFSGAGPAAGWDVIGSRLAAVVSLPLELCLATSLAVLLRATPHKGPWTGIIYVVTLLMLGGPLFAIVKMGFDIVMPLWAFAAGAALLSAALIAMANRIWTTRRLFSEAAKNAQP